MIWYSTIIDSSELFLQVFSNDNNFYEIAAKYLSTVDVIPSGKILLVHSIIIIVCWDGVGASINLALNSKSIDKE